jgi:integrase
MSILDNLKNKAISESSLKLYLNNLKRLNGGNEIKNLVFLKDESKILDKIKDYKPNTRRTYLISIVSLLKEEPKMKKLYDKYYKYLMEYNNELKVNTTKSETQKENWITKEEIDELYKSMETSILEKIANKKKITEEEFNELLYFVVLSLYTLNPPRRNLDYMYMVIVKKYNDEMDKKFNYLDLENNLFHFNNYKTQGTYKTQTVAISPELQRIIKIYLGYHPLKSELKKKNGMIPFLVDNLGVPFETQNTITRMLNKIFGKRVGVSMLRNVYLTNAFQPAIQELQNTTEQMGTSSNTAINNYIKMD